ncbi:taurine ABC transporter substrate-binding protein [Paenibacillus radicis (ex Gao et al. 2016)]|uniref:Glycine/betaine ABC transporter substrate-binding protein n=1 Tax=Paenibacillus radicis (ex Gao et al. 2016) TaxID=1737354 RepID=A0A917LTL8_9BACL|nr:ABC transporter substrate-binding protein [Paenibacillus radicis (ex Gao et al. 2016)]GGG56119.1 glycine/betaine ABC transporter substrate-binding protein [Paenibacillus radicis (ex Gao et al. 2016)]
MKSKTRNYTVLSILLIALTTMLAGCGADKGNNAPAKETASATVSPSSAAAPEKTAEAAPVQPKEVKIGFQIIPNAELLVKAQGLVEKKFPDVKVTWLQFDSGRDVNTAIASGGIDLGLAGSVPVAIGLASQLPYQVYFLHDVIGDNEALAVRNSSNIAGVKDLAGKKIAVPFGSTTHFSLLAALKQEGVDPKSVTILDLQPPDIVAAWQRKDIDGAFVWQPSLAKLVADDGKIIISAKALAEKGSITADVGVVRSEFAKQYPQFLKDYVGLLDEAVQLYRTNPNEAAKSLAPLLSQPEADTLSQMNELVWLLSSEQSTESYLGTGTGVSGFAQVLQATGEFLVEQQTIPSAPDATVYQQGIYNEALAGK